MKINEIKAETVHILLTKGGKQISFEEPIQKSGEMLDGSPFISIGHIHTDKGFVKIETADKVYIQVTQDNTLLRFDVKHEANEDSDIFICKYDGVKIEQRQAYRLPLGMRCEIHTKDKSYSAILKDVSIMGFCTVGTGFELKVGDTVNIKLTDTLPGKISTDDPVDIEIFIAGTVVRMRDLERVKEYGLKITNCDANKLVKYISIKQRELLKREK